MLSSEAIITKNREVYLDHVFKALGDPTRRKILAQLANGPATVSEIAKPYPMSLPAVGKHLRVLERAGLINRSINGRIHECALDPLPLKNASDWIDRYQQFWDQSLSSLTSYLRASSDEDKR